jgi:hypothetical protein
MMKTIKAWMITAILLAVAATAAFAKEPMTISGVWYMEQEDGSKVWYYFSPGGVNGTAVGVASIPDVQGGQQIIPFTGTWDFEEKDGKQLFCVYGVKMYVRGRFFGGDAPMPGQGTYRFYTEDGKQKMEFGSKKEIWTKIGTKVSDLPEIGPLAVPGFEGPKFWSSKGIVVK